MQIISLTRAIENRESLCKKVLYWIVTWKRKYEHIKMYEADERPKFERNSSIKSLRRTMSQMSSKSTEDPDAEPEFKVQNI